MMVVDGGDGGGEEEQEQDENDYNDDDVEENFPDLVWAMFCISNGEWCRIRRRR